MTTTFDHSGTAVLAEDPGRGEDKYSALHLERSMVTKLVPRKLLPEYRLRIFNGDDDMAYSRMSAEQVRALGQALIALADEPLVSGEIPNGVYYANGNFYSAATNIGLGADFYEAWLERARDFPAKPE